tara:strand:- start:83 stop:415 length:333 start_codon:yes stop_codon:yes gene_type:complete
MLLTGCPKEKFPESVEYLCDRYEMLEGPSGEIYQVVSDTTLIVEYGENEMTILGACIALDENNSYSGYHTVCNNSTFYTNVSNGHSNLEAAYEIPMGDSTLHISYIGTAL